MMYTVLPKYYDIFMRTVDYDEWTDYVCSFLDRRRRGVDFACGSGKFTIRLKQRGYDIYGVDLSPQMLNCAVKNARDALVDVRFVQGDMSNFKFIRPPEFVTAMCDAVNYLKEPIEFFCNVYDNLSGGGIFVFDISSAYKLRQVLGSNTYSDTADDITYIWNNALSKNKDYIDMELTFFEKCGDMYKKSIERQRQYVHEQAVLVSLLKSAGFNEVEVYGQQTRSGVKDTDERIHFIAKKE